MKVHIIAVGGRIMHTIALNLLQKGNDVTGSDDEIYEPSKSRLKAAGILPIKIGWDEKRITENIDLVILGMHAKADNPELRKALKMGLEIMSYPEFIYQQSKEKRRIVIAGSHGKTSTTAMIMHVLKYRNANFDYLIGAELTGFDSMIRLTDAPLIIIEGDEYLSSCIDRSPKMLHYNPSISVITGIAWDHVNVFKTEEQYNDLFASFIETHENAAKIFAYNEDETLHGITEQYIGQKNIKKYSALTLLDNGNVLYDNKQYRIKVFGKHNRANMMAALQVCKELGITAPDFFAAISTFKGASKRMEVLLQNEDTIVYRDFAHAPSKVRATVEALKEHYKNKKIIAILELHTFSSLNSAFLPKYKGALDAADERLVFFSAHTLQIKNMKDLTIEEVQEAFSNEYLKVVNNKEILIEYLAQLELKNAIVVLMSSGNFDKLDVKGILTEKL